MKKFFQPKKWYEVFIHTVGSTIVAGMIVIIALISLVFSAAI